MTTWIFLVLLGLTSTFYFLFLIRILIGIRRIEAGTLKEPLLRVAVVIPVRNEENTIESTLNSVLSQDYPLHLMEVIVVDDASADRTRAIVDRFSRENPRMKLLALPPDESETRGRKPEAIAKAVALTDADVIMTTDGDCMAGKSWVHSMISQFDEETAFVAGPVLEEARRDTLSRLSAVEFLGLITTTAGLIASGRPIICNGANLAYRRSAFEQAGGYGSRKHFSDDEVLMQRIATRRIGRIAFCADPASIVRTRGPANFHEFWNQRIRWASKRGHYENNTLLPTLVMLFGFFLLFLASMIGSTFLPTLIPGVIALFLTKMSLEAIVLSHGARLLNTRFAFGDFLIAELLHVPYIVIAAAVGQFASIRWKGRPIRA